MEEVRKREEVGEKKKIEEKILSRKRKKEKKYEGKSNDFMMLSSDQSSMSRDQITTFTFFPLLSLSLKLPFSFILRATSPYTLSQLNRHGLTYRPFFITFAMRSIFLGVEGREGDRDRESKVIDLRMKIELELLT